jgi:ABC-type transporter Mla subunit MlaD
VSVEGRGSVEGHGPRGVRRVPAEVRRRLDRRAAGRALIGIGVFGIVVTLLGAATALVLLDQLEDSVGESLELTAETLVTLDRSLDVVEVVVTDLRDGLATAEETLDEVAGSVDGVAAVATRIGDASQDLPERAEAVDGALAEMERVGAVIDRALRTLSALPIGPDYDPSVPLAETVARLRAQTSPLTEDLAAIGQEIGEAAPGLADLDDDLAALAADVGALRSTLAESSGLLDDYRERTAGAARLAVDSEEDLSTSIRMAKVMVVLLGAALVLGQLVPLWIGREVLLELRAAARLGPPEGG